MSETMDYPCTLVDDQSIGAWLKELRESKGMSVADIASHLRLDVAKIKAMESDECPEGMQAYVKGYIRHYAKIVGAESADVDVKIASMKPQKRVTTSPFQKQALHVDRFRGLLTQYRLSLLVLLASLIVIWIIAQAWASGDDTEEAAQRIETMVSLNEGTPQETPNNDQPDLLYNMMVKTDH